MKLKMVDVSIVLITYKMRSMLDRLLASIKDKTQGVTYETIVIDNCSEDGTIELIEKDYPEIVLIKNSENKGVAPARNQGFEIAQGKYIVTLDADMLFVENSLKVLFDFMEQNDHVGLCGCKLIFEDGTVQPSGRRYPTFLSLLMRRLDYFPFIRNSKTLQHHEMADWDRKNNREIDYLIGACQFIRRTAMEQIGLLDAHIFYGPEDLDYCIRMYRHDWKVYYIADTNIIHFEQRITKKKFFSKITFKHLSGIIYIFKKYNWRLTRK